VTDRTAAYATLIATLVLGACAAPPREDSGADDILGVDAASESTAEISTRDSPSADNVAQRDPPGCIPARPDVTTVDAMSDATSDAAPVDPRATEFSFVTYNVLHGIRDEDPAADSDDRIVERLGQLARELAARRPAMIFLQEILVTTTRPGYPDILGTLTAALNAAGGEPYVAVFGDIGGYPPACPPPVGLGEATLTRLPVVETHGHSVVSVQPFSPRSVVHVRVRTARGLVDTYNVHLQGPDDPVRAATEMRDVLAFVAVTQSSDGRAVIAGDFNSVESDTPHGVLRDAGFVDLGGRAGLMCARAGDPGCSNSTMPLAQPGRRTDVRIDYIFVRGIAPDAFRTTMFLDAPVPLADGGVLWTSDHIGVLATE